MPNDHGMKLNDVHSSPSLLSRPDSGDAFDFIDMAGDLLVNALYAAASRPLTPADVPQLVGEIADLLEQRADGTADDIAIHYFAARLRETTNEILD